MRDILLRVDAMRARAKGLGEGVGFELSLMVDTLFPITLVGAAPNMRAVYLAHRSDAPLVVAARAFSDALLDNPPTVDAGRYAVLI